MATSTLPGVEAPLLETPTEAIPSIASLRRRFPAPISHVGHDVVNVNALLFSSTLSTWSGTS
jgi:hypothetical protein